MDIDLYGQLIRKYWTLMVGIVVVATLGSALFTATRQSAYEGSVYVSVAQTAQEGVAADIYQYGDFYGIQGSNFLADYLRGWLKDPATVEQILTHAGSGLPNKSLTTISRFFSVKPLGTVGLQILHTTGNHDETNRILTSLQTVLSERLTSLQEQGLYQDFRIVPGHVLVVERKPDPLVAGVIGFGAGLMLAVIALLAVAVTVRPAR